VPETSADKRDFNESVTVAENSEYKKRVDASARVAETYSKITESSTPSATVAEANAH